MVLIFVLVCFILIPLICIVICLGMVGVVGYRAWGSLWFWHPTWPAEPASPITHREPIRLPLPPETRTRLACEFAWVLIPIAVISSFGMMTAPHAFLSGLGIPMQTDLRQLRSASQMGIRSAVAPDATTTVSTTTASTRPAWTEQTHTTDGDCEWIVLTSSQYTTREEAESELRSAAVMLVEEDFRRIQSGPFRPKHWHPVDEDVIAHAVTKRYDDVAERDFGSFTHPMHRVSWQVELSPRVRSEFLPEWRRALISFRILFVASVASLCAMVASSGVIYFRLDSLTQGRSRGRLKLLACTLVAVWWLILAVAFSQKSWW